MHNDNEYIMDVLYSSNIFYIGPVGSENDDVCVIAQEPETDWLDYNDAKTKRKIFICPESVFQNLYEEFINSVA